MRARTIILAVALVTRAASAEVATYGVQRTTQSGKPLWRDDRFIAMTIDTSTVRAEDVPAITAGFTAWETATDSCGGVIFGLSQAKPTGADFGKNMIHIRTDRWCPRDGSTCYDPSSASITHLRFVDDPNDPDDGKILDVDVELNAVDFELLLPGATPTTAKPAVDLQAVVTHEAGHVLGLAHDCAIPDGTQALDDKGNPVPACDALPLPDYVRHATMYYTIDPGDLGPRTPKMNDVAGACALLGRAPPSPVIGGCSASGGGAGAGAALLACAWLWRRRRSQF